MRTSGLILSMLVIFTSAVLIYHRANTAIKMQWVEYQSGSDTVRAFVALPEGKGPFPGVIVIHEWWGLNDWVKAKARALAKEGYLALAIDLYRGQATDNPEIAHELMRGLPEDQAKRDLAAAYAYLARRQEVKDSKISSIGWCMGGGYALQSAVELPGLAACVINYGRLITDEKLIAQINAPILGVFGGKDRGIPLTAVRAFEQKCERLNKSVSLAVYPDAGHGFMNENNKKNYRGADANDAWQKTLEFLAMNLK